MVKNTLLPFICVLLVSACSNNTGPAEKREFDLSFRYGVLARNELNTFNNSITKDLVLDGTVTMPLVLKPSDLARVESKMQSIDFYSYPDTFMVKIVTGGAIGFSPANTYELNVFSHGRRKSLYWSDCIVTADSQAVKLRELIALIREIVESTPEYKQLPPARGGYI